MRKTILGILAVVAVTIGAASIFGAVAATGDTGPATYEVTIMNLTRGQIFSPATVVSHNKGFTPIYKMATPASSELAQVAEDAMADPLQAMLLADPMVNDVQTATGAGGPILPGETATVTITTDGGRDRLSLVGMLVSTNDAFYGLSHIDLPVNGAKFMFVQAFDAGTETNTETCELIPGPPCGSGGQRDVAGAEGYVHVHAGIHGIGDLDAATYDWRSSVAKVKIERIN